MLGFILNLLRMIFGGSRSAPSEEAKAAAGQAAAQTALKTEIAANDQVRQAVAARDAADIVVLHDPASVRDPDKYSRD